MEMYGYSFMRESDIQHHGIKGQKWGVRRFQNEDGTWTAAGKERYGGTGSINDVQSAKSAYQQAKRDYNKAFNNAYNHNHPFSLSKKKREESNARWEDAGSKAEALNKAKKAYKESREIAKVEKSVGKFESKVAKESASTLAARDKNRAKLEKKNASEDKIRDFDKGTEYVKAGQNRVNQVVGKYKTMRISAIKDSSIKKSPEYKAAVKEFNSVARSGISLSTLAYAMEEAAKDT